MHPKDFDEATDSEPEIDDGRVILSSLGIAIVFDAVVIGVIVLLMKACAA